MKKTIAAIFLYLGCLAWAAAQDCGRTYVVRWFDDLDTISKMFSVSKEAIMKENNLSGEKLWPRQVLKIPSGTAAPAVSEAGASPSAASAQPADSLVRAADEMAAGTDTASASEAVRDTGNVAMCVLMPMSSGRKNQDDNSLDFYCGVLMAAKTLGEEGVNVDINVYDFSKGMPFKRNLDANDFVIGPVRSADLGKVLSAVDSSTFVVSPLDHRADSLCASHKNFVQAAPMMAAQYEEAVEWGLEASDAHLRNNVILICSDTDKATPETVAGILEAKGLKHRKCICGVTKEIEGWDGAYDPAANNIVILATANVAVLNNAIRNLGILAKNCDRLFVAGGSKLLTDSSLPAESLHKCNAHCLGAYYVDYSDGRTRDFILAYRALFHTDPSEYAFQGYDLACFLGRTYAEYGEQWKDHIARRARMDMYQASFRLCTYKDGGCANKGTRRVEFTRDFKIVSAKK